MRQKSSLPIRKVSAVGVAGALTTLIVYGLGIEMSGEVAAAITTLIVFVTGYLVPPAQSDGDIAR
jgi:hypothetical protein